VRPQQQVRPLLMAVKPLFEGLQLWLPAQAPVLAWALSTSPIFEQHSGY